MTDLKNMLISLSNLMGIPGYEAYDSDRVKELIMPYFDDYTGDAVGNHIFIKKCGKENAPKMLIDAHYDEIGMVVSGIHDGGFLSVVSTGGMDRRTMPAGEVTIYGKNREKIYGLIVSTPPHLATGDRSKLPNMNEFRIDTGFEKEEIEKKIELGAPVTMLDRGGELLNGYVSGKSFDNRSSVAAAVCAAADIAPENTEYDVYLAVSAKEETGMNGAKAAAFRIRPDIAVVVDVNIASTPDTPKEKTVKCGEGAAISISAITDRKLTEKIISLAAEKEIKHQTIIEPVSTGTNADALALVASGIPAAVIGVPLKGMHTPAETLQIQDLESLRDLIAACISCGKLIESDLERIF